MTCRSCPSVKLGDFTGSGCSCFPSPSCTLFPRRADGKVVLPNPLDLLKDDRVLISRHGVNQRFSTNQRPRAATHSLANKHETLNCRCPNCTPIVTDFVVPSNWKDTTPPSPEQNHRVSYDQLRSFPEFKAFKLHQDGKMETRKRANTNTESTLVGTDKTKTKGEEWMEEIRVTRRTKKQAYVRSGTHDFCIRLYSMDQKKD